EIERGEALYAPARDFVGSEHGANAPDEGQRRGQPDDRGAPPQGTAHTDVERRERVRERGADDDARRGNEGPADGTQQCGRREHSPNPAHPLRRRHASSPMCARRRAGRRATSSTRSRSTPSATNQGVTGEVELSRPLSASVAASGPAPATRRIASALGVVARAPPHGATSAATKCTNDGRSATSLAGSTSTLTSLMQPAPTGCSLAAGSPSTQRAS